MTTTIGSNVKQADIQINGTHLPLVAKTKPLQPLKGFRLVQNFGTICSCNQKVMKIKIDIIKLQT